MGMNAVDMALNEGQMLTVRQLCNIYNFPSELLNDKELNRFNGNKEAKKAAITNTVLPELRLDRDSLNSWYLEPYRVSDRKDYYLDFEINDFPELQEDLEKLWSRVDNSWELTPNERREMKGFDKDPKPEMDVQWIPSNLIPINAMGTTDTAEINDMLKELGIKEYSLNGKH